jgi:hypothetical protein
MTQGEAINDKHIEVIIRQMMSYPDQIQGYLLLPGDIVEKISSSKPMKRLWQERTKQSVNRWCSELPR